MSVFSILKSVTKPVLPRMVHDRIFGKVLSWERFVLIVQAVLPRVFGKWVYCPICGKRVAKVMTFVRDGKVEVWGMHLAVARVDFADRLRIRFTHALAQDCKSPEK